MEPENETKEANAYAAPASSSPEFASKKKPLHPLVSAVLVTGILVVLLAMLLPAIQAVRSTPHSTVCINQCRQIALAFLNYESANGHFPPAYIADENGKPMHSWRVLILPFMEQQALYDLYDMDEPWDGPNNSKLHDTVVSCYRCPSATDSDVYTSYVLITGAGTGFDRDQTIGFGDLDDGASNTILVTEIADSGFHWMKPQDITLDQFAVDSAEAPATHHKRGRNVALFDGSVHVLSHHIRSKELRKIALIDDGKIVTTFD